MEDQIIATNETDNAVSVISSMNGNLIAKFNLLSPVCVLAEQTL